MKTEKIKLKRISTNEINPRTITEQRFQGLVDSLLTLPKMLELRPIVIDETYEALGGNRRTDALNYIAKMGIEQLAQRLANQPTYQKKSDAEKAKLVEFWGKWMEEPFAYITIADELSEDEKKQFMIKDNLSYGTWDYDMLANRFDNSALREWGMEVWDTKPTDFVPKFDEPEEESVSDEEDGFDGKLPAKLDGVDLTPDELPKLQGTDDRPCDYVIITYDQKDKPRLLELLGVDAERFTDKICYTIDEIQEMR